MHRKANKLIVDGRKKSIHVAVVDDHRLIRQGIISQISRGHRIKIVGEAINGIELFNLLNEVHIDVVLLDVQMPEMNGPQTLHKLKLEYPELKVLIISMFSDPKIIREMIRLGASGFVNKDIAGEELIDAIYNVNFRGMHAQNEEIRSVFNKINLSDPNDAVLVIQDSIRLKDRDITVLKRICEGNTSDEIADEVQLSKQSIDLCRLKLIAHFGARNMAHLVAEAIRLGYYFP